MRPAGTAVRIVAALGLALLLAALVYAATNGRLFLFPFLVLVGFPMAAVFRTRRPAPPAEALPPPDEALPPPSRISLN